MDNEYVKCATRIEWDNGSAAFTAAIKAALAAACPTASRPCALHLYVETWGWGRFSFLVGLVPVRAQSHVAVLVARL